MLKKYHVSKNLFDMVNFENAYPALFDISGSIVRINTTAGRQALYSEGLEFTVPAPFSISFNGESTNNAATNGRFRLQFDDDSYEEVQITKSDGSSNQYVSATFNKNLKRIKFNWSSFNEGMAFKNLMLNLGSTPLPYEPYSSEVWHEIPYYLHNTSTDTITTLPADIYANAATATVGLKGQTVQSGTPTPQNPIMPNGCGERTGNLVDIKTFQDGMHLDVTTGLPVSFGGRRIATIQPIDVSQYNNVTVAFDEITHSAQFMYSIFNGDTLIERVANKYSGDTINTSNATKMYLSLYSCIVSDINYIMGNAGSTPLLYEPYGYKLDIKSANTTIPVYLGEVQTTRKIKKLVLDGTETGWAKSGTYQGSFFAQVLTNINIEAQTDPAQYALCSHAPLVRFGNFTNGTAIITGNTTTKSINLWIGQPEWTVDEFKACLAQQYANGTPVTVWYVLATEETAVVNEPLMKIGDYADEVSNVSIPVTAGGDTISVGTTLQPSEITANYKGWHPKTPKESNNGQWS